MGLAAERLPDSGHPKHDDFSLDESKISRSIGLVRLIHIVALAYRLRSDAKWTRRILRPGAITNIHHF